MFRLLLRWARAHKNGKLKLFYYSYRWFRLSVVPLVYQSGCYLWPDWIKGHLALANLLEQKYSWLASRPFQGARKSTKAGQGALDRFQKVIALDPESIEAYRTCSSLLFTMGKVNESFRMLQRSLVVQKGLAERHHLDRLGVRFISPVVATGPLGVMAFLDTYVRAGILGLRPPGKPILLVEPDQSIPNPRLLDYWRPFITVISDPIAVGHLRPLVRYLEDPLNWGVICGGKFLFCASASAMLHKRWDEEKRPPVLNLSQDDYERGWGQLEAMGVPKGSWFVCLHVREAGYKDAGGIQDSFRNADIETYLLAVKSIVARGGWVIRMGNPTMKHLPEMESVVDYAHSKFRRDWMDVFLCAQCRFFINNSSGLGAVAAAFGVPYVLTNFLPTSALHVSSQDLFIPKLCRSVENQQYLNFEGLMSPPVSTSVMQHQYDHLGLEVVDNSPEEINDLITEMLDRLDGRLVYSAEDERLQKRFRDLTAVKGTLYGLENFPVNCRIGRGFLSKYASLLPPVGERRVSSDDRTPLDPVPDAVHS